MGMGCLPFRAMRRRCKVRAPVGRFLKEKRARLYIIRRCVTILICWRHEEEDK
ncbi:hypothetical protein TIFTF001_012086 [Ficus carica]|uniref:Uncharacterized protein n=1 Tax=Ficus carica TaxID=3494 RepID=A0AA88DI04_FICCA|nr:hypothetical protein TIFTF001_012086 [Ficus carica]